MVQYASVNLAPLQDSHRSGADLSRTLEALLHNTLGLKPGYLPENQANNLLVGSLHMMALASYLDTRSA